MHLYVFPNAVNLKDCRARLDLEGGRLRYSCGANEVVIDPAVMRDGSSAMVLRRDGEAYVLYNFREILQLMNMAPRELLSALHIHGLLQADKGGDDIFVKAFLPQGQETLDSCTDDFSRLSHMTADAIHPLDWSYSWTIKRIQAGLIGEYLAISLEIEKSAFRKKDVYISHGGQTYRVEPGFNTYQFKYIPKEDAYLGDPNCRYKGRAVDLERLLKEAL